MYQCCNWIAEFLRKTLYAKEINMAATLLTNMLIPTLLNARMSHIFAQIYQEPPQRKRESPHMIFLGNAKFGFRRILSKSIFNKSQESQPVVLHEQTLPLHQAPRWLRQILSEQMQTIDVSTRRSSGTVPSYLVSSHSKSAEKFISENCRAEFTCTSVITVKDRLKTPLIFGIM